MASRVRKRSSRKQEILMFAPNSRVLVSLLFFNVMWLYITWVRIFDEVLECPLQRKKKRVKCRTGGHGSVRVLVIARFSNSWSFFQSFPYALCRGAGSRPQWGGVRDSEVSARRELTVYAYAVLASGICIPFNRYNSPGHASRNLEWVQKNQKPIWPL